MKFQHPLVSRARKSTPANFHPPLSQSWQVRRGVPWTNAFTATSAIYP